MRRAWTGVAILFVSINVLVVCLTAAEASHSGGAGGRLEGLVSLVEAPTGWASSRGPESATTARIRVVASTPPQVASLPLLNFPESFSQFAMLVMLGAIAWGLRTL